MGTRERYEHGVFSYVELATSDAEAAEAFYGELFGWEFDHVDTPGRGEYANASRDGHRVGALFEGEQTPHWNSYVTVDDIEETVGQVDELGGTVVGAPSDVGEHGRMAVVQDPAGAVLNLWEAKDDIGATLVNAPGSLSFNDLQTTDVDAAADFYAGLLGWEVGDVEGAPDERKVVRVGEAMNGGMAKLPESAAEAGVPPHWLPIFAVDDVDATVETAEGAGGKALAPGMDIPAGRMAVLTDPQGALFAVFAGELDE